MQQFTPSASLCVRLLMRALVAPGAVVGCCRVQSGVFAACASQQAGSVEGPNGHCTWLKHSIIRLHVWPHLGTCWAFSNPSVSWRWISGTVLCQLGDQFCACHI